MTAPKPPLAFDEQLGWMPAIPLPYYCGIFRPKFRCRCGEVFKKESLYQEHYALTHVQENQP